MMLQTLSSVEASYLPLLGSCFNHMEINPNPFWGCLRTSIVWTTALSILLSQMYYNDMKMTESDRRICKPIVPAQKKERTFLVCNMASVQATDLEGKQVVGLWTKT